MFKNIFKIALSLVLTAFAMAGCKADDDITITSFSLDGASYVCFEAGQTICVKYNLQRVSKIEITEAPEGWTVTNRNSYLEITAPQTPYTEIEIIEVKGTSPEGNSNTDKLKVQVLEAQSLSDKGIANCYIAPTTGRYSFDATAIVGRNDAINFQSAELVWCAPKDAVYSIQTLEGKVSFSTSTSGNAVIAVRDASGKIVWSWHIWTADYNPTEESVGSLMSRNLGAWAESGDTDSLAWASSGLYYQWGRKDPFVGGKQYMSTVNQNMYNAKGEWVGITYLQTSSSYGTIDYATQNPLTLIYGAESTSYDWLYAERNNKLWDGTTKSMYDPCPAGWIVASAEAFEGLNTESSVDEYLRGWEVTLDSDTTYLAAAGRRSFANGELTNVDVTGYLPVGFVWTATTDGSESTTLEFTPTTLGQGKAYRSNACPVRCRKQQ